MTLSSPGGAFRHPLPADDRRPAVRPSPTMPKLRFDSPSWPPRPCSRPATLRAAAGAAGPQAAAARGRRGRREAPIGGAHGRAARPARGPRAWRRSPRGRHRAEDPVSAKAATSRPASRCSRSTPRRTAPPTTARRPPAARAEANLIQAAALSRALQALLAANAVSKQDYNQRDRRAKLAEADVENGKALVQTAKINLDQAFGHGTDRRTHRPRAGHRGRAGGAGRVTPLALIQQIHPLFVNFTQSANDVLLRLRAALDSGGQRAASGEAVVVRAVVDELGTPVTGRLLFSDLSVDQSTGQIMLRAEVPNPQGRLLPGCTCVCASKAGRGGRRDPAAAAGRCARERGRYRQGGAGRRQGRNPQRQARRAGQRVGRARAGRRRAGDGRRLPELRGLGPVKAVPGSPQSRGPRRLLVSAPAPAAARPGDRWRSSSSIGRSSPGHRAVHRRLRRGRRDAVAGGAVPVGRAAVHRRRRRFYPGASATTRPACWRHRARDERLARLIYMESVPRPTARARSR